MSSWVGTVRLVTGQMELDVKGRPWDDKGWRDGNEGRDLGEGENSRTD